MLTDAILLLGPTGTGKSPLGNQIEKNGLHGNRCVHFDFGHELRSIANSDQTPEGFHAADVSFIRDVLDKGLLLENEHFHIAEKIVLQFFRRNDFREDDILILNGLPRHASPAASVTLYPFASIAVRAAENVQPVPWYSPLTFLLSR